MEIVGILVYITWVVMNSFIAKEKNRSTIAITIFSIFCTPIFAYLYLLAVPKLENGMTSKSFIPSSVSKQPATPAKTWYDESILNDSAKKGNNDKPLKFNCPTCDKTIVSTIRSKGDKIICKYCNNRVIIPENASYMD